MKKVTYKEEEKTQKEQAWTVNVNLTNKTFLLKTKLRFVYTNLLSFQYLQENPPSTTRYETGNK